MRSRGLATSRARARLATLVLVGSLAAFTPVGVAAAQVTTVETVPPAVDADGRTADERIDQVVVLLRILGVVLVVGTAGYWWRTRPSTVARLATAEPVLDDRAGSTEVVG